MTSQNFPQELGNKSSNSAIYSLKTGLTLKNDLLCPELFFSTQNLPPCQFQQFSSRRIFSFSKFLGHLKEKRATATP